MNSERTGENSKGEPRVEKSVEDGADDGSEEEVDDSDVERESDDGEEDDDEEEEAEEEDEEDDEDEYIPSSSKRRYSDSVRVPRTIFTMAQLLELIKQRQEGGKAAGKPPPRKRGKMSYPASLSIPTKPPKFCEIPDASSEQKDKRDEWKSHWGNYRALRFSAFLKRSYVQHWKAEHAVRELVQNLRDGAVEANQWQIEDVEFVVKEDGSFAIWAKEEGTDGKKAKDWRFLASITTHREPMKYWDRSHPHAEPNDARFKTMQEVECEVLRLQNFGVHPTWDILCLGQTKKRGAQQRNQVGTHGEGLKMALRVLCDQGYAVTIHTDGERWDPYYSQSDTLHYRRKVLDKAKWRHDKFVVEVYRPTYTWKPECVIKNFTIGTFLLTSQDLQSNTDILEVPGEGHILCQPKYGSALYVKDFRVREGTSDFDPDEHDQYYGYNCKELPLNRDRDAAAVTGATRTAFANLWANALDGEEDLAHRALDRLFHLFFDHIHDRLDPGLLADVQHLPKKVTPKGALRVVARFAEVQGETAYPVYKGSQHRVVRRLRRRPVEVCRPLYDILTSTTIPRDEPARFWPVAEAEAEALRRLSCMPDFTAVADVHADALACVEEVRRQAKDMYDIDPQAVVFKRVTEEKSNVGRCQVEYAVRVGEGEGARLMSCDAAWREDGEEEGEEEDGEGEEEGEEKPLCFFLDSRLVSDMDNVHKLLHGRYTKCPSSSSSNSKEESCDCAVDLVMKRLRAMKASALGKRAGARFLRQWESRMRKGAVEMQRKEAKRLQEESERKLRQQEEEKRKRWEQEEEERKRRWQQEEEERQARIEQARREEEERRREKEEEWRQLEERVRRQREEDERRRMQRQEEEDRRLQQLEKEKEEEKRRQQQQAVAGLDVASATEDRPEASSVTEEPAQGPFKGGPESPTQQPCSTEEGERQPLSASEAGPKDVHEEDDDDDYHDSGAFFGGGGDDSSVEGGTEDRGEGPSLMEVDDGPMRTEDKAEGGKEDLTQADALQVQERQTEAPQSKEGEGAEQPVQPPEQREDGEAQGRGWVVSWGGQREVGEAQGGAGGVQAQPPLSAPLRLSPVRRWWVDEEDDHDDDTPASSAEPTYRSPYSYTPKKSRLPDARSKRLPAMSRELVALQKDQISRLNAQLARLEGKVQHFEQHKQQQQQQQQQEEVEEEEDEEEEDDEAERRKGELEGKLTGLEKDLEGEQARVKALKAKLTAKEEEMKRLKEVEEEVSYWEDQVTVLTSTLHACQRELKDGKAFLIKAGEEHPGLVPLRLFGTVSEEEVEAALLTAFSSPSTDEDKDKRKGGKRAVTPSLVNQAMNKLDGLLRDPNLHLFRRREGRLEDVDGEHKVLQQIEKTYGQPMVDLLIEKRREVEEYNPSGCYPVSLLWEGGRLLKLREVLELLVPRLVAGQPAP